MYTLTRELVTWNGQNYRVADQWDLLNIDDLESAYVLRYYGTQLRFWTVSTRGDIVERLRTLDGIILSSHTWDDYQQLAERLSREHSQPETLALDA